jgi:hypothetical protein
MTINISMKSVVIPLDLKEIVNQISQDSKDKIVIAAVLQYLHDAGLAELPSQFESDIEFYFAEMLEKHRGGEKVIWK